jgi:hypothetical protein
MARCDINSIKGTIASTLDGANTTSASPIDLSADLSTRVKVVMQTNPEKLTPQASIFPLVTVFTDSKDINNTTISATQLIGKRKADLSFKVVGMTWNDQTLDYKKDASDNDLEYLMENIEYVLRSNPTLSGNCSVQYSTGVSYHSAGYDEQSHLRIGILDLKVSVFY